MNRRLCKYRDRQKRRRVSRNGGAREFTHSLAVQTNNNIVNLQNALIEHATDVFTEQSSKQ